MFNKKDPKTDEKMLTMEYMVNGLLTNIAEQAYDQALEAVSEFVDKSPQMLKAITMEKRAEFMTHIGNTVRDARADAAKMRKEKK